MGILHIPLISSLLTGYAYDCKYRQKLHAYARMRACLPHVSMCIPVKLLLLRIIQPYGLSWLPQLAGSRPDNFVVHKSSLPSRGKLPLAPHSGGSDPRRSDSYKPRTSRFGKLPSAPHSAAYGLNHACSIIVVTYFRADLFECVELRQQAVETDGSHKIGQPVITSRW